VELQLLSVRCGVLAEPIARAHPRRRCTLPPPAAGGLTLGATGCATSVRRAGASVRDLHCRARGSWGCGRRRGQRRWRCRSRWWGQKWRWRFRQV